MDLKIFTIFYKIIECLLAESKGGKKKNKKKNVFWHILKTKEYWLMLLMFSNLNLCKLKKKKEKQFIGY